VTYYDMDAHEADQIEPIAIIGMALRVPGANAVSQFWKNMVGGVESISWFNLEELRAAGVPEHLLNDPEYVPASAVIQDADMFDAEFFGFSPAEATILDPQHRVFLECAWAALEDAGYDARSFDGSIGIYGGCFMNKYLPLNLYTNESFVRSPLAYTARNYNDKDFITGRVAYLMNLRGPAVTVQTACSTSLVATHLACQALLSYDCDMALVGGVAINLPLRSGYLAIEGAMFSPDGHCRPFDAAARGTLPGSGAVLVVLKRLKDALAAYDHIHAVIRSTAVNNDGMSKVSFMAPNAQAQAQLIAAAQALASVHPETIGYVETHGTGTPLGDPLEVAALTDVFRAQTQRVGYCALGSVKANIGHLDAAAGAAGLVRAVLALENRMIPPQANFKEPNPGLKLENSAFYIPKTATGWVEGKFPRRAAVSSFGVGGTNAHVILEEAPLPASRSTAAQRPQLIVLSARTQDALNSACTNLADHLAAQDTLDLADVAHTLAVGRSEFAVRRSFVASNLAEAIRSLRSSAGPARLFGSGERQVVFMFAGVEFQHPDLGLDLYDSQAVFREHVNACSELLGTRLEIDIRRHLFPSRFSGAEIDYGFAPNAMAATFSFEYALAQLWMSWGIKPSAMLGHGLGEYVAACLADVISLPEALDLTVLHGEILSRISEGRMMSVALPADQLVPVLGKELSLAAVNAPGLCVVSGNKIHLEELSAKLDNLKVRHSLLPGRMASPSQLIDPYLDQFKSTICRYRLSSPKIPYLSCVTGRWIQAEEVTTTSYWARQLRMPVLFAEMLHNVTVEPERIMLEVGPGSTLTELVSDQRQKSLFVISSLPPQNGAQTEMECLLSALGNLWEAGIRVNWDALQKDSPPRRVPLPTYPFQRRRFWMSPGCLNVQEKTLAEAQLKGNNNHHTGAAIDHQADDGNNEPATQRQKAIIQVWKQALGVQRVGLDNEFTVLGGDSLLAAQVLKDLRPLCKARLSIVDIFGASTVRQFATLMDDRESHLTKGTTQSATDFAAEIRLDPAIRPEGIEPIRAGAPHAILLTGGTGFLGAFLLVALLRQFSGTIYCLVRAENAEMGEQRLRQKLAELELPEPDADRIVAVPGDLQELRVGLSEAEFDELSGRIDAIYHCGAWVNFVRPYSVLKKANVRGTEEVLRLATRHRLKHVHYISTIYVGLGPSADDTTYISEDDPLSSVPRHDTGYIESKWVAEGICRLAAQRGIPVTIYRPGQVMGDYSTGVANSEDYFTKVIQGCVQLGLAPKREYLLQVGTVDDVARAICVLSQRADAAGRTYHTVQPDPLSWNRLFEGVQASGYDVSVVSWAEWCAALTQALKDSNDNALAPLADMINEGSPDRRMPRFGIDHAARGRAEAGLEYPILDTHYMGRFISFFERAGWIRPTVGRGESSR
jgi:phthiocerol/phenolphthiocerol synthesis type-I polyketide synthase E